MKVTYIYLIFLLASTFQSNRIVFDIPQLKDKNIIQIRAILGKPKIDDLPLDYKTKSGSLGDAFFEKDGFTLEVTYNPVNHKVNDFFLGKDHAISNYKILEEAANLLTTKDFKVDPVSSSKDRSLYSGISITQK